MRGRAVFISGAMIAILEGRAAGRTEGGGVGGESSGAPGKSHGMEVCIAGSHIRYNRVQV